jgi:aminoglycoside 6'-N-acetyltransferase I
MEQSKIIKAIEPKEVSLDLLSLADPSEEMIKSYLDTSLAYGIFLEDDLIGAVLLYALKNGTIEIKNLTVYGEYQNQGFGKKLLQFAIAEAGKLGFQKVRIATGNSSIGQLALYQKLGFEMLEINRNFFLNHYPEPLFENGIACKHQVVLEMRLD